MATVERFRALLQRMRPRPERVYRQSVFFVPRSLAYWCSDCDAVGAASQRCPRCQSTALLNLARVLPARKDGIRLEAA